MIAKGCATPLLGDSNRDGSRCPHDRGAGTSGRLTLSDGGQTYMSSGLAPLARRRIPGAVATPTLLAMRRRRVFYGNGFVSATTDAVISPPSTGHRVERSVGQAMSPRPNGRRSRWSTPRCRGAAVWSRRRRHACAANDCNPEPHHRRVINGSTSTRSVDATFVDGRVQRRTETVDLNGCVLRDDDFELHHHLRKPLLLAPCAP